MDARYAQAYPELYRRHWWWRVREEILLDTIARLRRGRGSARLLDVGCGAGLFFDALERFGHVEGIESDAESVAGAGRWRSRIHVGSLDGMYHPAAPFDLILMLDVLEHVPEPDALLQSAARVLAPQGRVLITVPAFTWLWTTHDELNHHLRRYARGDLRALIARAGLRMESSAFLFQSLVVPKLLVRVREGLSASKPRVPAIPSPALNGAIQSWFRAEHALVGWLPFGASLLAVAGKD
jgi:2-polyprenyl-3-methyl-5-hydroxy-6-metoxy-1,4-benzoquinol methylase